MSSNNVLQQPALRWLRRAPGGIVAGERNEPRLGVLSGTFNPPTRAHLVLAEQAVRQLSIEEVLFVLPEIPPHKEQLEATLEQRAEMLLLTIGRSEKFSAAISTHGLFLDIHRVVAPHYPPRTQTFFLTGRDAAERILLHWPYPDPAEALAEMFARFQFAVAARAGPFRIPLDSLVARYVARIHSVSMPAECETLSSTLARERMARGQPIEDVVPLEVASFVTAYGLYRPAPS